MPRPPLPALAATALLAIAITAAGPAPALSATTALTTPTSTTRQPATGPLLWDAVQDLPVAQEDRTGYKRTSFRHWIDADHNGCTTRDEVLIAEAAQPPQVGPGCSLTGGAWYSYYDDVTVADPAKLDVDHI